jgi:hypothetical protein
MFQFANMVWELRITKDMRLSHKHICIKKSIKESIVYIKTMSRLTLSNTNTKHCLKSLRLYHWTKYFLKINPFLLMITFSHQPCFVELKVSFALLLILYTCLQPTIFIVKLYGTKCH